MKDAKEEANRLSSEIINAAIEVHRALGPRLLESAYEACLRRELSLREIPFKAQVPIPIDYKGISINNSYRIDLLVDKLVIIELKSIQKLEPIHEAQLLTYLRLTNLWLGLLINFNVPVLKQSIRRKVLG